MDEQAIRDVIFRTLHTIAPEVDPATLVADQPLRDQVDLDSMDWLNFLVGLHQALKVDIPESDYQKLYTLDQLMTYLRERLSSSA
ncbi:MAG: phosphopantetheine-binding protein [Candidatus Muproteobacteria bacterium RBG_16_64_11]|uniref:Phosphopantetheine-binding protein n=1 Tax=Candidatus Muproteobacteria bacterium RBG_16_64_11 TaxID=1817758 RepID=A0A1F6TFX9_9PROT|nr:MAG: phosphopantetheine-binding protein [Candidatus Muproteobacteria bacterium RBG_16_64_11]